MSEGPRPWERQDGESARAFEAFCLYRDMPTASRSLRTVAQGLHKSFTLIGRWSRTHRWVARVRAYEAEQSRRWLADKADERRKAAERHIATAQMAQSRSVQGLMNLDAAALAGSPSALVRLLEAAVRIERDAYGDLFAGADAEAAGAVVDEETAEELSRFRQAPPEVKRERLAELADRAARWSRALAGEDDE